MAEISLSHEPHYYRCYGLTLACDIVLPELDRAETPGEDIVIKKVPYQGPTETPQHRVVQEFHKDQQYFDFPHVARFNIHDGRRIEIETYPGVDEGVLGLPLLGPVMATLLHYRGLFVLHGSALIINDAVTILLGDRGAGKSTTAAFLVKAGFKLFNDDVAGVEPSAPGGAAAYSGYPIMKLGPDVFEHLQGPEGEQLPTASFPFPKIRLRLKREKIPDTLPIRRICLLERGAETGFTPLEQVDAIQALLRHAYMLKYGDAPMADGRNADYFLQAAALASAVDVGVLITPPSLDRLDEIIPILTAP